MSDENQTMVATLPTADTSAVAMPLSPAAPARFDRVDWLSFGAATLLALGGYLYTLAPNLTLAYSGIVSTGAMYAGVPQPPGYPVWTLYSWLFVKLLPFSNIAWRVAVGSAVASAVACGLVALMVSRSGAGWFAASVASAEVPRAFSRLDALRIVCGTVAGLVLAFSSPVWRNAVVAETKPLSLLLFSSSLCLLFRWSLPPERCRYIIGAIFLFGLLLTNSQDLIVVLPGLVAATMLIHSATGRGLALLTLPVAVVVTGWNGFAAWIDFPWLPNWPLLLAIILVFAFGLFLPFITSGSPRWSVGLACSLALLLGLAAYLYLPVASMSNPPVNWGYPRTTEGFLHVVSRGQYERTYPVTELSRYVEQIWDLIKLLGNRFGWLYLALAIVPFGYVGRLESNDRRWLASLAIIWICVALLMLAELNPYPAYPDRQAWEMIEEYFAPACLVLAICLGLGLMIFGAKVTGQDAATSQ